MLSKNISTVRKSKGLSQQELALKLHVVRQTISKWEQGLSVPDADMLISISEVLEVPVSKLLGENMEETKVGELEAILAKLEVINAQLAQRKASRNRVLCGLCIFAIIGIVCIFSTLCLLGSPYMEWDLSDPETAVIETTIHSFEWVFVRIAPFVLIAAFLGLFLLGKRN